MTDAEAKIAAIEYVYLHAQWALRPKLSEQEIAALVDEAKLASTWTAATPYAVNDRVRPIALNGRWYRCVYAGTSAAIEPTWTLLRGGQVVDGTVLVWEEDGPQKQNIYDLRKAVHLAWKLKAAKASPYTSGNTEVDANRAEQQVYEHCQQMAAQWMPWEMA